MQQNTALEGRIPKPVLEVASTLEREGERAWIVGGCLRDLLLGRAVHDWDLATTATPARMQRIFPRTIPTGVAHGTVTVLHRGHGYEVTTLRGEGAYTDGRRPDSVEFVEDIERDLERRDFTVNAIAYRPATGEWVDPFGGLADLEAAVLRAVREPRLRFREDGLRVLRGARFVASLGFRMDPATEAAIPEALDVLAKVSRERVRDEWMKTMKAERPSLAFAVMARTGILGVVAPELDAAGDLARAYAPLDAARDVQVRHAALLSSIGVGEPAARTVDALLTRLRYSNDERRTITRLVRLGPPPPRATLERPAVRRLLREVGRDLLPRYRELLVASLPGAESAAWLASIDEELAAGMAFEARDLAIRGDEVAAHVERGPAIRQAIESLLAWVDEDPSRNQHDPLIARLLSTRSGS